MSTIDEQLVENPVCIIDRATRKITVHEECKFFGVENDKRVERIKFECSKEVGDENVDLTTCKNFIAYENAKGEPGLYEVTDLVANGDVVHFTWLFDEDVTRYKGNVKFIFYACKPNGDEYENAWNTIPAIGVVEEGLKAVAQIQEKYASIVETMLLRIATLEQSIATAPMTVTIVDGAVNYDAKEIYAHVQAGGAVELVDGEKHAVLIDSSEKIAHFASFFDGTLVSYTVYSGMISHIKYTAEYMKAPYSAKVGQTIVVKAVDSDGTPTVWEAVDMPNEVPFVKTDTGSDTLEWDGSTEDLTPIDSTRGFFLYKVSDITPVRSDFANGAIFTVVDNFGRRTIELSADNAVDGPVPGMVSCGSLVYIAYAPNMVIDQWGVTIPEAGTYFVVEETGTMQRTASITLPGYTGFPNEVIDPIVLPKISWNDLPGKPFVVSGGDTLAWDGNTDGLVWAPGDTLIKVSDATPALSDFANGCVICVNGGTYTHTSNEITEDRGSVRVGSGVVTVAHKEAVGVDFGGLIFTEPGTYFMNIPDITVCTSITIPGYVGFTTEKIDPKVLPDVADIPAAWIAALKTALGI